MKWYKPFEKEPPKDRPFLAINKYKGFLVLEYHGVFKEKLYRYYSKIEGLHYCLKDFEKWTEIPKDEDDKKD